MINSVKPLCSALPRPLLPAEFSVTARSTIRMKGAAQVAEKTPAVKLRAQSTNQGMWTISSLLRGTNGPPPPMIRRSPVRHEATRRHWSPDAGRVSERKRSEKRAPFIRSPMEEVAGTWRGEAVLNSRTHAECMCHFPSARHAAHEGRRHRAHRATPRSTRLGCRALTACTGSAPRRPPAPRRSSRMCLSRTCTCSSGWCTHRSAPSPVVWEAAESAPRPECAARPGARRVGGGQASELWHYDVGPRRPGW